jgi:hypothetical protein
MASNFPFPASLDSLTNPTSSDSLNSPSHSAQHANSNDAIEALQAKVGADSSAVTTSLDYKVAQLEAISHGKILQVVSTTKTDPFTASLGAGAFTSVTGLSATITPTSASSKILVMVDVNGAQATTSQGHITIRLLRGATEIGSGGASGSRTTAFSATRMNYSEVGNAVSTSGAYLDSPATTSATTYSVQIGNAKTTTQTMAVNRSAADTDNVAYIRTSSTIVVMEVSA